MNTPIGQKVKIKDCPRAALFYSEVVIKANSCLNFKNFFTAIVPTAWADGVAGLKLFALGAGTQVGGGQSVVATA
jgi:hypothetical protein